MPAHRCHPNSSVITWLIGNSNTSLAFTLEERAGTWRGLFAVGIVRILTYSREHLLLMASVTTGRQINTHTHTHTLGFLPSHLFNYDSLLSRGPSSFLHLVSQADKSSFSSSDNAAKKSKEYLKFYSQCIILLSKKKKPQNTTSLKTKQNDDTETGKSEKNNPKPQIIYFWTEEQVRVVSSAQG